MHPHNIVSNIASVLETDCINTTCSLYSFLRCSHCALLAAFILSPTDFLLHCLPSLFRISPFVPGETSGLNFVTLRRLPGIEVVLLSVHFHHLDNKYAFRTPKLTPEAGTPLLLIQDNAS